MAVAEGNPVLPHNEGAKSVMFEEEIELVDRNDEATREEDLWYTSNEYFFMRRKATNLAKRMGELDNDVECSRGLEIVESTSVQERGEKIRELVQAVIEKQKQDADPEAIAELSKKASHVTIQESLKRAKDDATDAKHILADIRKEWSGKPKFGLKRILKVKRMFRKHTK